MSKYTDIERIEQFNKVNTPIELLEFMNKYIEYGIIDADGKIYDWNLDEFQKVCQEKWKFQKGKDIVKSGYGHCWDQTEIEREWFISHGYEYKTIFILFEHNTEYPYGCHTYLVFKNKNNNNWNWFEHADGNNIGIHTFSSLEEAILAQREKHIEFTKNCGLPINDEILDTIHIYEYAPPKAGSSNQEFIDNIFSVNSKDITSAIISRNKKVK